MLTPSCGGSFFTLYSVARRSHTIAVVDDPLHTEQRVERILKSMSFAAAR